MAEAGEFNVTIPQDAAPGSFMWITSPAGVSSTLTVPADGAPGQEVRCVRAKNAGLAAGAFTGGGAEGIFKGAAVVGSVINPHVHAKKPGEGVFVPCAKCGANNETKMCMSNMARFDCGACGAEVRWRPRQVWLRDQGSKLEKPVNLQDGEVDSRGCVVS
eukprot:CAMPEP_0179238316 /NCGR_PEP_ID=MMETSP0797-20121207/14887_1 /TAXON_ID=47934 /ORGANISM="Dinophysis acuminata, Strain DAEP01" /LENGTH=159 /DNA_ID=CAMNT_0020945613 /DNA_START=27 /DNA_END=506 /DNA_ORIENTATION=-